MQDFKKLDVWHQAHRLAINVYQSCDPKRFSKYPGKRAQILRCADSIPANISEGSAKRGAEFARYLDMSLASTNELDNHLLFARDVGSNGCSSPHRGNCRYAFDVGRPTFDVKRAVRRS